MHLSELLNEDAISLELRARDKESAIKELVQLLESAHHVDTKGEILSKVLQRESMMSTASGTGWRSRTARPGSSILSSPRAVSARAGIDFDSMDGGARDAFHPSRLPRESQRSPRQGAGQRLEAPQGGVGPGFHSG